MLTHTARTVDQPVIRLDCERGSVYWKLDESWNIRSADGRVLSSGLVEAPHNEMFSDVARRISGEEVFCCPLGIAREHTHCIELLTKTLKPKQLHHSVHREAGNGQFVLENVNEVFEEGYRRELLPSELGIRWS